MSALATAQSPAELERMGEGALPYLASEIFACGGGGRRLARRRFRMLKALDAVLEQALEQGERVHLASWGVECLLWEQLFFGLWSQLLNRRALVVTDRRLLLLQLDHRHRPMVLRSQILHGTIASVRGRLLGGLALRLHDGRKLTLSGVPRRDRRRLVEGLERFRRASGPPASGVQGRQELCPHCSVPVAGRPMACPRCHRPLKSASAAAALSFAFPGLGDLYLGLRGLGALEVLGAGLVWVSLGTAALVPASGGGRLAVLDFAAVGAGLLLVMHLPDALVTLHSGRKGLYPGDG